LIKDTLSKNSYIISNSREELLLPNFTLKEHLKKEKVDQTHISKINSVSSGLDEEIIRFIVELSTI